MTRLAAQLDTLCCEEATFSLFVKITAPSDPDEGKKKTPDVEGYPEHIVREFDEEKLEFVIRQCEQDLPRASEAVSSAHNKVAFVHVRKGKSLFIESLLLSQQILVFLVKLRYKPWMVAGIWRVLTIGPETSVFWLLSAGIVGKRGTHGYELFQATSSSFLPDSSKGISRKSAEETNGRLRQAEKFSPD